MWDVEPGTKEHTDDNRTVADVRTHTTRQAEMRTQNRHGGREIEMGKITRNRH